VDHECLPAGKPPIPSVALSREPERDPAGPTAGLAQAAVVAYRHACAASVRKVRSVRREMRWR
jgi:hypothetical protein